MTYLFGDNERATRRLRILAQVFKDSTVPFLESQRDTDPLNNSRRQPTILLNSKNPRPFRFDVAGLYEHLAE